MVEDSLILRLKRGEQESLAEIYSEYREGFIHWITNTHQCTRDEAIEIFQHSILTFYENVVEGSFEGLKSAGIKTYLYSIGKNKLLADYRKNMRISSTEPIETEEHSEIVVDVEHIKSQKLEIIKKAIQDLGDPCRKLLELFYFNNLSIDEIAEIMDYKNGNTVKNLKYKCIQRIKKALEA